MVMVKSKFSLIFLIVILISLFSISIMAADNQTSNETINTTSLEENLTTQKTTTPLIENSTQTNKNTSTKTPKIIVTKNQVKNTCLYYFTGTKCALCLETDTFIITLQKKYPDLKINQFEVYYNKTNRQLLQSYLDAYEIDLNKQGIPIVFLPTSYLLGPKAITQFLEGAVNSNTDASCPDLTTKEVIGIIGKQKGPKNLIEILTFSMVTAGAFGNNITPGALAVLLVLLILFLGLKTRRRLIGTGITFTLAIYLVYLLAGVGLLSGVTAQTHYYFYKIVGGLAILIGSYILKERFLPGLKIIPKKIPEKLKKLFNKSIKIITYPAGAFIVGFIVALFQLSSTQGIYKILLELATEQVTKNAALPLLLFHNFIFILYLIVITLLIGYSMKRREAKKGKLDIPDGIEHKLKTNLKSLHFFISLIMFILGIIVVFFL